ncbi:hypothetical protein NDN08_001643 [Rhodosorus marinus]|uniref:50S ribosomal protein L35 n=1 Tax=Rhodosorus marinus TaxID=101924 RepID=A0AAV8URJ0_9RHOD|nr:hypothetical protein NDN08_001643 [Rhodosorus marinus]
MEMKMLSRILRPLRSSGYVFARSLLIDYGSSRSSGLGRGLSSLCGGSGLHSDRSILGSYGIAGIYSKLNRTGIQFREYNQSKKVRGVSAAIRMRFKITPTGKILRKKAGLVRKLMKKSGRRKRHMRGWHEVHKSDLRKVKKMFRLRGKGPWKRVRRSCAL